MIPWREAALARNYRAAAAFPIAVAGRVRGTFSLYVDRPNYFDAAELELLDELAADIGFALGSIESDAARETLGRRLIDLLETMGDGFVRLRRDWSYEYVNRQAAAQLGRKPADLLGRHIWTEFPGEVGQPFGQACERAMREGDRLIHFEDYYPPSRKAGSRHRIYPTRDGISIFFSDITETQAGA
jgi:PAS domain-containing protein